MREFDTQMQRAYRRLKIGVGDIYESCSFHPVLCLGVDYKRDEIWGVSLIDGTYPRSCSLIHCGICKLSPKQAWQIKMHGPIDPEARQYISEQSRWWNVTTEQTPYTVRFSAPRKKKAVTS
jgi:hypothetical protein